MSSLLELSPILDLVRSALPADTPIYLVGGAVRDVLLQRPIHDYDFAMPGNALEIGRKVANQIGAAYYVLDAERSTARVIYTDAQGKRHVMDFAAFRGNDLESDLRDRDFTLNAMALDLHAPHSLLDPLGGAADLKARVLRACSPAAFQNDPVRILRAIRGATAFDLQILAETRQQMRAAIGGLARISPERIRDELLKILGGPHPQTALRALDLLGVLPKVMPELAGLQGVSQSPPHIRDVWQHTLDTLRYLEQVLGVLEPQYDPDQANNLYLGLLVMRLGRYREQISAYLRAEFVPERPTRQALFLAALYHDIGKPQTRQLEDERIRFIGHEPAGELLVAERAGALHLSNQEIDWLKMVVRQHMRPVLLANDEQGPSQRAVYRFFRDTGEAGIGISLLALADVWATYGATLPQARWSRQLDVVRLLLEAWWEKYAEQVSPPLIVNGHDLISELGLNPGPLLGQLLEAIREAQATGQVHDRETALDLARQHLSGLESK